MQSDLAAGMAEATGLTRAGRLAEATALIQRLLGGGPDASGAAEGRALPLTGAPGDAAAPAEADPARGPAAARRTGLRETLRRLRERARASDAEAPGTAPSLPEGARFEAARFEHAAGARDYKLFVPGAAAGDATPRPLVLMLHGCTQDPDDFARGTAMNAAAEAAGCLIVYPAQPAAANANRCWNWFRPEDQRRGAGEPALLAALVRALVDAEAVDPDRVYVAGLSAGGAAAAVLAAEYPDLFAAVGVHSGLPHGAARDLPSALAAMRGGGRGPVNGRATRAIVFHGDADRVVHPANADALVAQAIAAAGRLESRVERGSAGGREYSRELHLDGEGRTICEHWTLHGAGHAWAGGDGAGSHVDPAGPDASREMLRFFLET